MKNIKSPRLRHPVMLTDYKWAVQYLQLGSLVDRTFQRSVRLLPQLNDHGIYVRSQWVPSHVGVLRNEAVDKLAHEGASRTRFLKATPDEGRISKTDIKSVSDVFGDHNAIIVLPTE